MCSPSASTKPPLKSRANKRRRSTTTRRRRIITSLPSELFTGILSHVASNSVDDLFNARATCKLMSKSGSERHVVQNASVLDKFCHYFYGDRDEGIRNLRSAAEKDMKAAKYACGILSLLAGGDVEKEEGLRFLEGVMKKEDVRECRNMVKFVMDNNMWVNGDRGMRLEKKNKNEVVIRRCGCVGKLRCFSKNPDYVWLSREEQVVELWVVVFVILAFGSLRLLFLSKFVRDKLV
ncbi:hypothetical protein LINPERPRIM_LOCUS40833 [Linum perenne]